MTKKNIVSIGIGHRASASASSVHDEGKDRREQSNKLHTTIGGETTSHEIDKSKAVLMKTGTRREKTRKKKYAWVRVGINRIYSPSMITIAMKNVQFTIFVLFAHKLLISAVKTLSFFFSAVFYCFLQAFRVCIYENIFYI